jgi:hypothetical protein
MEVNMGVNMENGNMGTWGHFPYFLRERNMGSVRMHK